LVVLGAGRVGKSSIVSRFLHGKFVETYKPTVEDLHCRTFHVDGSVIQVNRNPLAGVLITGLPNKMKIKNGGNDKLADIRAGLLHGDADDWHPQ